MRQADRPLGRKRCFTLGLSIYGVGAVLSAVAPGLGVLILGNSIFEGVGTAPPWSLSPRRPEPAGRLLAPPGRFERFAGPELLVQPGRDLQVERRGQRQRTLRTGQVPRLLQPFHALRPELVDRAELVQRPRLPQPQPVRSGHRGSRSERLFGRVQATLPRNPADNLQCLAGHLGKAAVLRSGQRRLGEPVRVGQLTAPDCDLRRARIRLRCLDSDRPTGDLDTGRGVRPAGTGDCRAGYPEVQVTRPGRVSTAAQPGQQRPARLHRAVHLPGQREHFGERLVDRSASPRVVPARPGEVVSSAAAPACLSASSVAREAGGLPAGRMSVERLAKLLDDAQATWAFSAQILAPADALQVEADGVAAVHPPRAA